jgi:hypothetical protein
MRLNAAIYDYQHNAPDPLPKDQLIVIREECLKQTAFKLEADGVVSSELEAIHRMLAFAISEIVFCGGFEEHTIGYIHHVLDVAIIDFDSLDKQPRRLASVAFDIFTLMRFGANSIAEHDNKKYGSHTLSQCYTSLLTLGQLECRQQTVEEILRYTLRYLMIVENLNDVEIYKLAAPIISEEIRAKQAFEEAH